MKRLIQDLWRQYKLIEVYPRRKGFERIESLLSKRIENLVGTGVVIEKDVGISDKLDSLGDYVFIGEGTRLYHCKSIGAYSSISQNVKIGLRAHPKNHLSTSPVFYAPSRGFVQYSRFNEFSGETIVGPDVLISSNVQIISGVSIGRGAIIGAGAFVNHDIPDFAIAVGTPAKVIGYRFDPDTIEELKKIPWEEWTPNKIMEMGSVEDVPTFIQNYKLMHAREA